MWSGSTPHPLSSRARLFAFDNSSTACCIYCVESLSTDTESPYTDAESLYTDMVEQTPIGTDYTSYPPQCRSARILCWSDRIRCRSVRSDIQSTPTGHQCCCTGHSLYALWSVGQYISSVGQARPPDSSGIGWWRIIPPLQQSTSPGYINLSIHVVW